MRQEFTLIIIAVLLATPAFTNAQIVTLWDQQPDTSFQQILNQSYPDLPIINFYAVNDVALTSASGFRIDSVTTYFSNNSGGQWGNGVTQGVVNIFDGDALVDSDDPTNGGDFGPGLVDVDVTDLGNNVLAVTASNLDISLSAGIYWFGLTPSGLTSASQEYHYSAGSTVGLESQSRNPSNFYSLGPDWLPSRELNLRLPYPDTSITVTGEAIPEPATAGLLTLGMIGFFVQRRRTT